MAARLSLAATVFFAFALAPLVASAQDSEDNKVVVYKLKAEKSEQSLADQLSDDMLLHLGKKPGLEVLGEAELKVMLGHEKDKKVLKCDEDSRCLAQLQAAVQAERVITGHVGKMGTGYVVTLKLSNTKKGAVEGAEVAEAEKPAALAVAVREALDRLLGFSEGDVEKFELEMAPEGIKAAIVDLDAFGVDEGLAANLTQLLSLELKKFEGMNVISRDEIQTMLQFEAEKQQLQCTSDTSCLVEIGGALGVDYLVTGSVGKMGESYVISLKLMDVTEAKVVHRASESLRGSESELAMSLRFASWSLLGKPLSGTGQITVKSNIDEGKITLANGDPLAFPKNASFSEVDAGKYGVSLSAEGFYPLYSEVYVVGGRNRDLRLNLEEVPTAWYAEWWPWTILGVVIAGGVTTAVLLNPATPESGSVSVTVR